MPETATPQDFLVPDLGEGLEEATIVSWLVARGDEVALNQPLCTVETAKAEVDVPSPFAGIVLELGGEEGETLSVGSLLARIAPQVETPPTTDGGGATSPRPQATLVGYRHDETIDKSRRPRHRDEPHVRDDGPADGHLPPTLNPVPWAGEPRRGPKPLAKPPVRKLARELGVELVAISPGSGPGGVVTRADVHRAAAAASTTAPVVSEAGDEVEIVPVRGVRARIAEHLATSRARIPDATCSVVADCTRLLDVRASLNDAARRQGAAPVVTPFSLLCGLAVRALRSSPLLNASFVKDGPEIRVHRSVHLGIGTATDRGLVVTVVRDADQRAVLDLSADMARLAEGARAGSLTPAELQGSTFTLSNFGALGLDEGIPVINHPEAAILGVGSIRPRPHVVDGEVVTRSTALLRLAFDHRVCDGAEAGRFLGELRELVETPELALL